MWGMLFVTIPWGPLAEPLPTLSSATIPAVVDCRQVPLLYRPGVRYGWIPPRVADAELFRQVFSGHVHHESTEPDIVVPEAVPNTKGRLLRFNVDDYGEKWRKTWERLAGADPYGHVVLETKKQDWIDSTTKQYLKTTFEKVTAIAPWIADTPEEKAAIAELVQLTGSQVPIVRLDWFIWQTGIQNDRDPGYYDFLGIKDQKSFEDLVGYDLKLNQKSRRKELLEAVAESGVARQPRRISAENTVGGMKYWRTFDVDKAVDKKNPLRILDTTNFDFQATEAFGPLPNNLWAVGLWDNKGVIQKSAPDFVGHDKTSPDNNGRIEIGLSCIRCHYPNGGLQPIDAWARNLFQSPLVLQSPDPAKARELRQQYARDLLGPLENDRRTFATALKEATGMTSARYAVEYGNAFSSYESPVNLDRAAQDWGMTADKFQQALKAYLLATGSLDTVLSTFLHPPEKQRAIGIDQWHELQPVVGTVLKGVK